MSDIELSKTNSDNSNNKNIFIIIGDQNLKKKITKIVDSIDCCHSFSATSNQDALKEMDALTKVNWSLIIIEWSKNNINAPIFIQKLKQNALYQQTDVLIISENLTDEDKFLLNELDINLFLSPSLPEVEVKVKTQKLLSDADLNAPMNSKIRKLQFAIQNRQSEIIEELLADTEFIKKIESNSSSIYLLAEIYIFKKMYEKAVILLQEFIRTRQAEKAETTRNLSTLGKALCLIQKYDEALMIFNKLIAKSPKNIFHKINNADALLDADQIDKAKNQYKEVMNIDPENIDAQVGVVKATVAEGKNKEAKALFQKINEPIACYALASFLNNRAIAFVRTGKTEDAIQTYQSSMEFLDQYKAQVFFNIGLAYFRMGMTDMAKHYFENAHKQKGAEFLKNKTTFSKLTNIEPDDFVVL